MTSALEAARSAFAETIRREAGLRNEALARGFAQVRREDFLGPGPWQLLDPENFQAGYRTTPDADPVHLQARVLVAIDPARSLNNGDPVSLATWLDLLEIGPGDRFLHIGCGVGYYTAIAACAVGRTGAAVGIEIDPELARRAAANLAGVPGARTVAADAVLEDLGPFDAIFVNAGATHLRAGWTGALREGGRLLVPVTVEADDPEIGFGLMLLTQKQGAGWPARFTTPVGVFHCEGARDAEEEQALRVAFQRSDHGSVASLRFDEHPAEAACWLHGPICLSRRAPPS